MSKEPRFQHGLSKDPVLSPWLDDLKKRSQYVSLETFREKAEQCFQVLTKNHEAQDICFVVKHNLSDLWLTSLFMEWADANKKAKYTQAPVAIAYKDGSFRVKEKAPVIFRDILLGEEIPEWLEVLDAPLTVLCSPYCTKRARDAVRESGKAGKGLRLISVEEVPLVYDGMDSLFQVELGLCKEVLAASAGGRQVVFMDEPFHSVAPEVGDAIAQAFLRRFRELGTMVVLTSHYPGVARLRAADGYSVVGFHNRGPGIRFDYRLRRGRSTESVVLEMMRKETDRAVIEHAYEALSRDT